MRYNKKRHTYKVLYNNNNNNTHTCSVSAHSYYDRQGGKKKGDMPLRLATMVFAWEEGLRLKPPRPHCFALKSSQRLLLLQASSETERRQWMEAVMTHIMGE